MAKSLGWAPKKTTKKGIVLAKARPGKGSVLAYRRSKRERSYGTFTSRRQEAPSNSKNGAERERSIPHGKQKEDSLDSQNGAFPTRQLARRHDDS